MWIIKLFLVFLVLGLGAGRGFADDSRFFSMMHDLPLMAGLEELPGDSLAFDKPQGRVLEILAHRRSVSKADIQGYYARVLPQFGWRSQGAGPFPAYRREKEVLSMFFDQFGSDSVVIFRVEPVPDSVLIDAQ